MSSMLAAPRPATDLGRMKSGFYEPYECQSSRESSSGGSRNSWFASGLPTPPGTKAMTGVSLDNSLNTYPTQHAPQTSRHPLQEVSNISAQPAQHQRASSVLPSNSSYNHGFRQSVSGGYNSAIAEPHAANAIASHLQIPESINKSKGSLPEFAAEITCLFWFESAVTLQYAEDLPIDQLVDRGLVPDAIPSIGFRKWVTTILSTTQVGKNVILLALMFIYRLKKFNPSVSGKRGSEFRLLTIALMLGNKFLDDNTYTNKTWAEVSGISVTEIHIMEVEFLSNMRYDLYASESEWAQWKAKLDRFGAFYEKASKLPLGEETRSAAPVTPTNQSFPHKLPSPPSTHHSAQSYLHSIATSQAYHTLPNPASNVPYLPRSPLHQQRAPSLGSIERKRSLDLGSDLPPAKRLQFPTYHTQSGGVRTPVSFSAGAATTPVGPMSTLEPNDAISSGEPPRLPMPRIPSSSAVTQLAPLNMSVNRAMSTVYPQTSNTWSQPVTPISAVPSSLFPNPISNLGEGSRSHSNLGSTQTSPHGYSTSPAGLPGLSPSYFLTNRSSPYRPVRNVNTLLIPPPSAAMQTTARNVSFDQIHYQPLSKAGTERHTGPVPFLYPDAWHHSSASTPLAHPPYHYRAQA